LSAAAFIEAPNSRLRILRDCLRHESIVRDLYQIAIEAIARAIGVAREKHHRYLLNEPETMGVMLCAGSECVGYTYISSNGHIGPLAVSQPDVLGDAFTTALKVAADRSSEKISAFVPGTCHSALSLAVNHGMRITFPMLLMASPGFGNWTHYLPRNPGFM
jgi:hypothetical protein